MSSVNIIFNKNNCYENRADVYSNHQMALLVVSLQCCDRLNDSLMNCYSISVPCLLAACVSNMEEHISLPASIRSLVVAKCQRCCLA